MAYTLSSEFGFVIWGLLLWEGGYVIGRLRTRVLLALLASGNASEGARPSSAGAAGRRTLTAEQERRFVSFGGGHCTISWDQACRKAGAGAELVLDGRGKGPGGMPLVGPGGLGSVPTDGEQECWPSLCGANLAAKEGGTPATLCVELARRLASAQQIQCGRPREGWAGVGLEPAPRGSCRNNKAETWSKMEHCK